MIGAVGILNLNEFEDEDQSKDFKLDKDSNQYKEGLLDAAKIPLIIETMKQKHE